MSGSTNNFPVLPTRGNRRPGERYDAGVPNDTDWNTVHASFPRPHFRAGQNSRGGFQVRLPADDERVMGGTWVLSRFPELPFSALPFREDEIARTFYTQPSPRQYIPDSPPRFTAQMRSSQLPTQEEESRLSREEQNKALSKLKKEIYNPSPKRLAKRISLYYRDSANANASSRDSRFDDDEYAEKCSICLDEFEEKERIIRTPCNHMFHEDCIVPWIKSHGQCPVCRFAICERMRDNLVPPNNNITSASVPVNLLIELLRWDI